MGNDKSVVAVFCLTWIDLIVIITRYVSICGTRQPPAKSGQILWAPLETQFPLNMLRFMEIYN